MLAVTNLMHLNLTATKRAVQYICKDVVYATFVRRVERSLLLPRTLRNVEYDSGPETKEEEVTKGILKG